MASISVAAPVGFERDGDGSDRAVVQSLELLTEESLRARLQEMGIADDAAASYVTRARNIKKMNQGGSWERVTDVGYRNEEGQVVVSRTDRMGGDPEQRVYVMQCSVCAHEYGTYGSEIPHRCCPHCQDVSRLTLVPRAMTVHKSTYPEFVVLSFERPEGERFAIFRRDDWLRSASPSQWGSPATLIAAMEQCVRSLELMTEESIRSVLQDMGLAGDAIANHIMRARNLREMGQGGTWERVTDVGYRNEEGQVVVSRTDRMGGDPEQRVYVMQCSVCAHEYGTYGSEIPHCCCPQCQDAPPGLPV